MQKDCISSDFSKKWLDSYFSLARKAISPQTGFLHHYHQAYSICKHDTIPILENILYALACFRLKTFEAAGEGKALIQRLLSFEVDGNFPVYLHEFPLCKDLFHGLKILPALHRLTRDHKMALGERVFTMINTSIGRIVAKLEHQEHIPFDAAVLLDAYLSKLTRKNPQSTRDWAAYILALQMMPQDTWVIEELQRCCSFWHSGLELFIGDQKSACHLGYKPLRSLFDMIMFFSEEKIPSKALDGYADAGYLAPCVYPIYRDSSSPTNSSFLLKKFIIGTERLCLYWKDLEHLRSISIATKAEVDARYEDNKLIVNCSFPAELQDDDDQYELSLFLDDSVATSFYVQKVKATMFTIGQEVFIRSGSYQIAISITPLHGDPFLTGHIMKGSRPAQRKNTLFEALDWKIALRLLRRKAHDAFILTMSFESLP